MSYTICVNQPGCLPEMDPYEVETIEEAREALLDELRTTPEPDTFAEHDANSEQTARAVEAIGPEGGTVIFGGYVHCISRTESD